ncbi:hypothetical protein JCM8547_007524 [Rhodosporidiobolus lusitaniae]
MTEQELHDCAVCEARTTMCCSSCESVFFCSREHQKLIWSTHKWTYGKDDEPFSFPPLTADELADLEKTKDLPFFVRNEHRSMHSPLLIYLKDNRFFDLSWQELLNVLAHRSPPLAPRKQADLFSLVRDHLRHFRTDNPVLLKIPGTAWDTMSVVWIALDCAPFVPTNSEEFFASFSPFLRQFLILAVLRKKCVDGNLDSLIALAAAVREADRAAYNVPIDEGVAPIDCAGRLDNSGCVDVNREVG